MFASSSSLAQNVVREMIGKSHHGRTDFVLNIDMDTETLSMPVVLFKGAEPGPTFAVMAGVHGYEYPPIMALQEWMKEIDCIYLKGNILCVPIANTPAFYGRVPFLNPMDGKNLNTVFPGCKDGSATERLAHLITHEIIANCDVLVDIHGGDASEDLLPFVCYYNCQDAAEQTLRAKELCEKSGFEHIVSYSYHLRPEQPALYAFKQAVKDGKVALSIENGKLGNVQKESVAEIKSALFSMLDVLSMYLPHSIANEAAALHRYNEQHYIRSAHTGIFYSDYSAGDYVEEGSQFGYITDVFGEIIHHVVAPVSGRILYKIGTPPVNVGETICCLACE